MNERFFTDDLPYSFALPVKLNSILLNSIFFFFWMTLSKATIPSRKYQRAELGRSNYIEFRGESGIFPQDETRGGLARDRIH